MSETGLLLVIILGGLALYYFAQHTAHENEAKEIAERRTASEMISDSDACDIADDWRHAHSAFAEFADTGAIKPELMDVLVEAVGHPAQYSFQFGNTFNDDILLLRLYCSYRAYRPAIANWVTAEGDS